MTQYVETPASVPVTLTAQELRALMEASAALGYNLPGLTSATGKLKEASKAVRA